ncbi:MAG: hypothetical protein PF638_12745 [Candidatus Delongbacteria bacterium]|jgi:uncharacterized coiled-coil DUF342 family protein|nr:hypothetical protein [Candidatus Delongbacteria bacterium]
MSDFEELKQLFDKVSSNKGELKKIADEINKDFLIFEDMNYDCDDEIDVIEDQIEEFTYKMRNSKDKEFIQSKIDNLLKQKEMVQEAANLLNKLENQFNDIQSISEDIDVEV